MEVPLVCEKWPVCLDGPLCCKHFAVGYGSSPLKLFLRYEQVLRYCNDFECYDKNLIKVNGEIVVNNEIYDEFISSNYRPNPELDSVKIYINTVDYPLSKLLELVGVNSDLELCSKSNVSAPQKPISIMQVPGLKINNIPINCFNMEYVNILTNLEDTKYQLQALQEKIFHLQSTLTLTDFRSLSHFDAKIFLGMTGKFNPDEPKKLDEMVKKLDPLFVQKFGDKDKECVYTHSDIKVLYKALENIRMNISVL